MATASDDWWNTSLSFFCFFIRLSFFFFSFYIYEICIQITFQSILLGFLSIGVFCAVKTFSIFVSCDGLFCWWQRINNGHQCKKFHSKRCAFLTNTLRASFGIIYDKYSTKTKFRLFIDRWPSAWQQDMLWICGKKNYRFYAEWCYDLGDSPFHWLYLFLAD